MNGLDVQHSSTMSATFKTEQGVDLYVSRSKDVGGAEDMFIMASTKDGGVANLRFTAEEVSKLRGFLNMQLMDPR